MRGDDRVLDYLNRSLRSELTAINQYWLHYRIFDNWGFKDLAKKWREESIEEMHLKILLLPLLLTAGLCPVTAVAGSTSKIQTSFSGISNSSYPPHNALCVGPNNIVMVEGSQIEWTNLKGGSPTTQSVYSFFSSLNPTGGLYDPRCAYDKINKRYIVIMQYGASGATISSIDIAVSKDSNPNDGWYFAALNTSLTINGRLTASDRPALAVDGANIYITAGQFNVPGPGYNGTEVWVIGDTAGPGGGIYNGGALTVVAHELTSSSQGTFYVATFNNGKAYFAADWSNGSQILFGLQTYNVSTRTFSSTLTIGLGPIDQGGPFTAQQLGTALLLDAGDLRVDGLGYSNVLWGVTEVKPSGSNVPLAHWFQIDVSNPSSPALLAQGDISGAAIGTNVATFNASIAADAAGDVILNFTASGPNMYPADYYVYRGASDPPGFSAPVLYKASTRYFDSGDGSSVQRWGLYSSAIVDPNNSGSFWLSNEYVGNGPWQTSVARVCIAPLTSLLCFK